MSPTKRAGYTPNELSAVGFIASAIESGKGLACVYTNWKGEMRDFAVRNFDLSTLHYNVKLQRKTDEVAIETKTKGLLHSVKPTRGSEGHTLEHAVWMMENLPDDRSKRQRWVGYAQALLVLHGVVTLDLLRDLTRPEEKV